MKKDFAFLFKPGDYLRDTQCLSEKAQVAYDRIMCEHMRNICISQSQLNFFTKRLSPDEKEELLMVMKPIEGGFEIEWVAESIRERMSYSESRRKNRHGNKKEDMNNISNTYDSHMEGEGENEGNNIGSNKMDIYWEKWKKYKKAEFGFEFKGPDSESASKTELLNLCENSIEEAIDIIDYSIAQGYKGFVKRKDKKNGKPGKQTGATIEGIANAVAKNFASDFRVPDEKH